MKCVMLGCKYCTPYGEPSTNLLLVATRGLPMNDEMFVGIEEDVTPHSLPFISSPFSKK